MNKNVQHKKNKKNNILSKLLKNNKFRFQFYLVHINFVFAEHYSKSKATPVLSPGNNHSYISRSYHSSSSNKTKVKSSQ